MGTPDTIAPVTVLGECVADAFVEETSQTIGEMRLRVLPGGGPANTATTLARLGTPTRFLGRISEDAFGALFRRRLGAAGVDLADCETAAEHSTLAVAEVDAEGKAAYTFFAEGSADWQWTSGALAAARRDTACVHTGSLALVRDPGGRAVEEYLGGIRELATICIDPNVRPGLVPLADYRARLAGWCRLADILRVSSDDLFQLVPEASPEEACDAWHTAGVPLVVVTLGEAGALASLDGVRIEVPARPVDVVDSVGAGDAFTAGLLHRLHTLGRLGGRLEALTPSELADACAYGVDIAGLACSVPGADPRLPEKAPGPVPDDGASAGRGRRRTPAR